jgi:hypothetical protein
MPTLTPVGQISPLAKGALMSDAGKEHPQEPRVPEKPDAKFLQDFEKTIKSYAEATEQGNAQEATQAAFTALMMAATQAAQNPTPDLLLANEATDRERSGDWAGAENAYRQLLVLRETAENPALRTKPQMDLSRLLRLLGRQGEAWEFALAGTQSARASQISTVIAMALESQATCALERGMILEALQASSEAVDALEPGRLSAHIRARALILRAECRLADGDRAQAETDLKTSRELLEQTVGVLPGPILTNARWWEVRAKLDLQAEHLEAAVDALNSAIRSREQLIAMHGSASPHAATALARTLDALSELEHRRGKKAAGSDAAAEAKRLRAEAHLPPNQGTT